MEVCAGDVEAVHVAGNDGQQKQCAVEHAVPGGAAEHKHGKGREENVDAGDDDAVHESSHACVVVRLFGMASKINNANSLERSRNGKQDRMLQCRDKREKKRETTCLATKACMHTAS